MKLEHAPERLVALVEAANAACERQELLEANRYDEALPDVPFTIAAEYPDDPLRGTLAHGIRKRLWWQSVLALHAAGQEGPETLARMELVVAERRLDLAREQLDVLERDPAAYRASMLGARTLVRDEEGLPVDAFRAHMEEQLDYLGRRAQALPENTPDHPSPERALMEARRDNIATAIGVYKEKQRAAMLIA